MAMRSVREAEPVLIWPVPMATTKSASNVSSVSPLAMGDDGGVICLARHFDGFDGFAYRTDLVELDQDGVADAFPIPRAIFRIGDEDIVADELNFFPRTFR